MCVTLFGKANWSDQVLHKCCLLKRVIEGTTGGNIEWSEIRGRWRKQLRDELKEKETYRNLIEEALYHTVWRTRFGRGCGPFARQTTKWMSEWMNEWYSFGGVSSRLGPLKCLFYQRLIIDDWLWVVKNSENSLSQYHFANQNFSRAESGLCKWIHSTYFRRRCFQSAAYT